MSWLSGGIGLVIGAVAVWVWLGPKLAALRASQAATADAAAKQAEQYENRLREASAAREQAVSQAGQSQAAMQTQVAEMRRQLEAHLARIAEVEKERAAAGARIEKQMAEVARAGEGMSSVARDLRQALAGSAAVRGEWGEQALRNILNAQGLRDGADYRCQVGLEGGGKPDVILRLPSGPELIVDCKTPDFTPLAQAGQSGDAAQWQAAGATFAAKLGDMAKELARRNYPAKLPGSVPCVVMFVPSEAAFRAAMDAQPEMFRQAQQQGVVLASPTTVMPLMALISSAWVEYRGQQDATKLRQEVEELANRLGPFFKHFLTLGDSLEAAAKAYNQIIGSYQSRVEPKLRALAEMNSKFGELSQPKVVEAQPLALGAAGDR